VFHLAAHHSVDACRLFVTPIEHTVATLVEPTSSAAASSIITTSSSIVKGEAKYDTLSSSSSSSKRTGNVLAVDIADQAGWSPLLVACYYNQLDIVSYLYSCGADLNFRAEKSPDYIRRSDPTYAHLQNGMNPLIASMTGYSTMGRVAILKWLTQHGARAFDHDGQGL
jgi:ankyrin repeat protein